MPASPRRTAAPKKKTASPKPSREAATAKAHAGSVELCIGIDKEPGVVFRMLTDAGLLCRWLPRSAQFEPSTGGAFRFDLGGDQIVQGTVNALDPGRTLRLTWRRDEEVVFTTERTGRDQCILTVRHQGLATPAAADAARVLWAASLVNLKSILHAGPDLREGKTDRLRKDRFVLGWG